LVVVLAGASHRAFRFTLQGLNQLVIDSHCYLRLLTPRAKIS
jgi:hypothetical protein